MLLTVERKIRIALWSSRSSDPERIPQSSAGQEAADLQTDKSLGNDDSDIDDNATREVFDLVGKLVKQFL